MKGSQTKRDLNGYLKIQTPRPKTQEPSSCSRERTPKDNIKPAKETVVKKSY